MLKEADAIKMIKLLLKHNMTVNVVNSDGKTPLQLLTDYRGAIEEPEEYYYYDDEYQEDEQTSRLDQLTMLLHSASTTREPTSTAKVRQDIITPYKKIC